jgi:hypothetical protein
VGAAAAGIGYYAREQGSMGAGERKIRNSKRQIASQKRN